MITDSNGAILEQLQERIAVPVVDQDPSAAAPTPAPIQAAQHFYPVQAEQPPSSFTSANQTAPSIQNFIHVPNRSGSSALAQAANSGSDQTSAIIFNEPSRPPPHVERRRQAQPNWRFEANPNQQVPLLELQRHHYKLNQKYSDYQQADTEQASTRPTPQPQQKQSSCDLVIDSQGPHGPPSMPPRVVVSNQQQIPGCSPPTATTAGSTSNSITPAKSRKRVITASNAQNESAEMADFTDEKNTVDLMSDRDAVDSDDGDLNVLTRGDRRPPSDQDGAPVNALIPRSPEESSDLQFDCGGRQEQLRKELELARQFFGTTNNPRVDVIQDPQGGGVKNEAGNHLYENADNFGGQDPLDLEDDEVEIDEGVHQTASGHLLVQNQTGPVLSVQEQRAIAKRTRQEMRRRMEERNLVEYGGKCDDEKFVDFTNWPQEFQNMQSALDTYNKLGLPHRVMFRAQDHARDQGGISTRFRLVCFHNKTASGQQKTMQNSTNSAIAFKKLKQGSCPVSMTFKFKPDRPHSKRGQFVRSNHLIMQHNHPLTVDERRVLQRVEIQDEIQMYLESGLTMPMIVNCVNRKFGLALPYHAFGSVVQRVRHSIHSYIDFTQTQTMQLLQMLERMRQEDPMTRFAYLFDSHMQQREDIDPNNPQIEALLVQTPLMARNYQAFHDVVFLDSTYNTNQLGLALAILTGISAEGKNIMLGFAFMARETTENYKWVLENFVKMNNNLSPRTILTDYDSAMATAIETVFGRQTTHWLCQWHMMQNFKKHFVFLSKKRGAAGKLLFNHIIDCIYTESPKKFAELTDVIFSTDQLDEKKLGYLRKMFLIKEKWATAHQPPVFNAGMHTTSRVEAMNSMVKKAMTSRYTLVNLFQEILKIEQRVIRASREVLSTHDELLIVNNPLMASIRAKFSKWAFERMLYQHMLSHTFLVAPEAASNEDRVPVCDSIYRIKNDRTVFKVKDTETQDKCTVILIQNSIVDPQTGATFDNIRCNCRYYLSHEFFCSHIFAVLNLLQVKNAEKFHMAGRRWQRDHQESVLPGLYTMNDRTQNPEQYASQFKLYNNNGNVNTNYAFARGENADPVDNEEQPQYQMINTMGSGGGGVSIDFVDNGQRQIEAGPSGTGQGDTDMMTGDPNNQVQHGRGSSSDGTGYGAADPNPYGKRPAPRKHFPKDPLKATQHRPDKSGQKTKKRKAKDADFDPEKFLKKMRNRHDKDDSLICGTDGSERSESEPPMRAPPKQSKHKRRAVSQSDSQSSVSSESSASSQTSSSGESYSGSSDSQKRQSSKDQHYQAQRASSRPVSSSKPIGQKVADKVSRQIVQKLNPKPSIKSKPRPQSKPRPKKAPLRKPQTSKSRPRLQASRAASSSSSSTVISMSSVSSVGALREDEGEGHCDTNLTILSQNSDLSNEFPTMKDSFKKLKPYPAAAKKKKLEIPKRKTDKPVELKRKVPVGKRKSKIVEAVTKAVKKKKELKLPKEHKGKSKKHKKGKKRSKSHHSDDLNSESSDRIMIMT